MREEIEWGSGRLRSVRDLTSDIRLFEIEPAPGEFVVPPPGSSAWRTVVILSYMGQEILVFPKIFIRWPKMFTDQTFFSAPV